jgi:predicted nucleic acid binding AN1-type Zn finger protein
MRLAKGKAKAARIAMIAITTSNSINVNAACRRSDDEFAPNIGGDIMRRIEGM